MKKICISNKWTFSHNGGEKTQVNLPHDYSIKLPRNPNAPGGARNGFFGGIRGDYTKYVSFGNEDSYILDIDGAYMCSRIFFNDNLLDMHPHGYSPYLVDLTGKVRNLRNNKICITTQNIQPSTRWYSGSGVYRDVFLWSGGKIRIEPWDMFITTTSITGSNANINVSATITSDISKTSDIKIMIKDADDKIVACDEKSIDAFLGKSKVEMPIKVENAILWDTKNPYLYTVEAQILSDGKIIDTFETNIGIRTISADVKNGFMLNGKKMKLRGGCIHHDHGVLGSAEYPAAVERKISLLKNAGFNALRIAHNPPSLALMEVCDKLGMLVMDEAFDMWNIPKSSCDYSLWFRDWWERDISYMVRRDRNHPCIISYSIGNEIPERDCNSEGDVWAKKLCVAIRKHDATRLVTSGICGIWSKCDVDAPDDYKEDYKKYYSLPDADAKKKSFEVKTKDFMEPLDIVGYNYLYSRYEEDGKKFPNRVIWGSETHAINFSHSWKAVMENDHVIGDFTWTAIDNLGEAGTGRAEWASKGYVPFICFGDYPWKNCYQGDLDLCGFRRPQSYFREAIWIGNIEPRIFTTHPKHYGEEFSGTGWHWYDVSENWTFDDKYLGCPVKTDVYTDADEISFILNGNVVGKVKPIDNIATLDINYEKGELTAVSYKNGIEQKRFSIHTVGEADKVVVKAEKETIKADGRDLCYFDISITDFNGDLIPFAGDEITCELYGGGKFMGVFSGNPKTEDDYSSNKCHVFNGRAVAIVSSELPQMPRLRVTAKGLKCGWASVITE